jgi:hypothetical protein
MKDPRITAVLLGGLTYAAMHIVEGWSTFGSPTNATLSLIFVLLQYFGPGMFKSVLTNRQCVGACAQLSHNRTALNCRYCTRDQGICHRSMTLIDGCWTVRSGADVAPLR